MTPYITHISYKLLVKPQIIFNQRIVYESMFLITLLSEYKFLQFLFHNPAFLFLAFLSFLSFPFFITPMIILQNDALPLPPDRIASLFVLFWMYCAVASSTLNSRPKASQLKEAHTFHVFPL